MTEGDADTADPDDMAIDPLPAPGAYYRVGTTRRRLVVVSNRVPPTGDAKPDSGGLAVAIRSALQESGGVWFGWSGEVAEQPTDEPGITVDGPLTFATLDLSRRDYDEYYIGYANRVLWPLFHYRGALVEFSRRYLAGYLRVNQMFAQKLAPMLAAEDLIWVHDVTLRRGPSCDLRVDRAGKHQCKHRCLHWCKRRCNGKR